MHDNLTAEMRFSIIPEWITYADISDKAIRLYSVLARYAHNQTHEAFPSRDTLAGHMHCSPKSVDRATDELIKIGAITKRQRHNSSLVYTLRVSQGGGHQSPGGSSPVSRGVDTDVHLTRTTELEPNNDIETNTKRAQAVPADWQPSDPFRAECEQKWPTLIIAQEVEAFIDFHIAKGSVFKDVQRAFRTWCRNATKWEKPRTVIHKQEVKPAADIPGARAWVRALHDQGEHWECRDGEFDCK
jgi:hypothetical protein